MGQQPQPTRGPGRHRHHDAGSDRDPPDGEVAQGGPAARSARERNRDEQSQRERVPFACQHGNRLLLLEPDPAGWILAELRFDPGACHYLEVRRSQYASPREAAGALMSRALSAGNDVAERTARNLDDWLALL